MSGVHLICSVANFHGVGVFMQGVVITGVENCRAAAGRLTSGMQLGVGYVKTTECLCDRRGQQLYA